MSTPKWLKYPERIPSGYMWESVKEHKKLKRENTQMRKLLSKIWGLPCSDERFNLITEIRAKMPGLFKGAK